MITMLKTLKDLVFEDGNTTREVLKSVAIAWIKEISKDGFKTIPKVEFIDGKFDTSEVIKAVITQETDLVVRWIEHFFGISKSDIYD